MSDNDLGHWFVEGALSFGAVVLSFFGRRTMKQLDDQAARLSLMERTIVTREELREYFKTITDDRRQMHADNQRAISELRQTVETIHSDVLDLSQSQKGDR